MQFKIDPAKVTEGLKRSLHASDKYKGRKIDRHQHEKGHTSAIKKI